MARTAPKFILPNLIGKSSFFVIRITRFLPMVLQNPRLLGLEYC
jgi:hypothetical protein